MLITLKRTSRKRNYKLCLNTMASVDYTVDSESLLLFTIIIIILGILLSYCYLVHYCNTGYYTAVITLYVAIIIINISRFVSEPTRSFA